MIDSNENDNDKIDRIVKTYIDQDLETNIENIACLGKTMSLCNKQHLSNIWGSIYEKLSNTDAELKKSAAYKKKHVLREVKKGLKEATHFLKLTIRIAMSWNHPQLTL